MTETATQPENAKKTSWFSYVKSSFKPKTYVSYAVLALLIAFFLVFGKGFKQTNVLMLEKISYSVIAALSLSLVVGFLGELSLGQAGFMCLGAYFGGYFQTYVYGAFSQSLPLLSLLITMLLGGFFAAIAGLIIGLPALRLKGDYLAIVTLAFGEIVKVVFRNLKTFGAEKGMETIRYSPSSLYIIGFFAVLFTLVVIRNFIKSKHGRAVTAIRDNEIAARAMGVNVTYYKLAVFVLSAFFAGVAGVLFSNANYTIKSISFDYNYSIDILVMVVLGGMGSLNGTMLSAALITFLNAKLSTVLTGDLAALQKLRPLVEQLLLDAPPAARREQRRVHAAGGQVVDRLRRGGRLRCRGGGGAAGAAVQHAVGLLHIKAAAGARLGQTLGGQHLVGGVYRVDADALLRSHRAAARQRCSGCALAGADLIRQGGVQLLIQRRFLVGIQLYHDSPPYWPHKKFKN